MRAMMTLREQFIHVFSAFAAVSGVAEGTLSDRLLRSGGRFKRIRAGSDISTGTFERVVRWLSDNWPEGADWPEGVDRPGPAASSATVSEAAE